MRYPKSIDAELNSLVAVRSSIRVHGVEPGCRQIDELLDERNDKVKPFDAKKIR